MIDTPRSSLNGYYERVRKILRLIGVSDIPIGVTPVVIVADSREPGATSSSYRKFTFGYDMLAGAVPASSVVKMKFLTDVVITGIAADWQGAAANSWQAYVQTAADIASDPGATYIAPNVNRAAWVHNPESGPPPFLMANNGTFAGVGRLGLRMGVVSANFRTERLDWFIPQGGGIHIVLPVAGTNYCQTVFGYALK